MADNKESHKQCFVIGPMKDMARLRILSNKIVKPILEPYGFKVITPDDGAIGTIMDQVLLNLEQADILVADITGNNPNVMYELGVYHSFGKPSIIVKEIKPDKEPEQTPFDIAAYRFIEINLSKIKASINALSPKLQETIKNIGLVDWFPNPVTSFYDSPVAEIPTAVGLSKNYIRNFLDLIIPGVFLRQEYSDDFQLKIMAQNDDKQFVQLDNALHEKLKFEILIPKKMQNSSHNFINNLKASGKLKYRNAKVIRRTREFNLHIRFEEDGTPVLADIPTVLATLNESIMRRRNLQNGQINNKEWNLLEAQELERFATKCEQFKRLIEIEHPIIEEKVKIVWNWDN